MEYTKFWVRYMAFCKAKGVTWRAAACGAGVHPTSLPHWKERMPTQKSIDKVAKYFGVTSDYFLNGQDVKIPELKVEATDASLQVTNITSGAKPTVKEIQHAIVDDALEHLTQNELDAVLATLKGNDTWLPPHIKVLKRWTCLGALEIILYNSQTTTAEEALNSDGYDTNVMVMDERVFKNFFAK